MKNYLVVALIFFLNVESSAKTAACRPPTFGGDSKASAPSLVGRVISTDETQKSIVVTKAKESSKSDQVVVIGISEDRIFTQYERGTAEFGDIVKGDEVRVWTADCVSTESGKVKASVVVILK